MMHKEFEELAGYEVSYETYDDDSSRIADYNWWWLRSPYAITTDDAGDVSPDGRVHETYVPLSGGARPAFNLNLSSVLFSSLIPNTSNQYKLTLKDSALTISTGDVTRSGDVITVSYSISGTNAGDGTKTYVLVTDEAYTENDAEVLAYTELAAGAEAGTGAFMLDSSWGTVYLLAVNENGDKATDYASTPLEISIPHASVTAYSVTVNNGTGGGEYTEGSSVTITANEPEAGKQFKAWTGADGLTFTSGSATNATATFSMPAYAVTLTATYEDIPSTTETPDPTETATPDPTETPEPMDLKVKFVFLKGNGNRCIPFEVKDTKLSPSITIKDGKEVLSQSDAITVEISGGEKEKSMTVTFSKKLDLAPGKYSVSISGLPKTVDIRDYGGDPAKYKLSAKAEINTQDGDTIILVYLIFKDRSVPDEPVVYALPEDEIGAYALRADGTKEYLLFHTYDICMAWLGRDDLCSGNERCFHKEFPYIFDNTKVGYYDPSNVD